MEQAIASSGFSSFTDIEASLREAIEAHTRAKASAGTKTAQRKAAKSARKHYHAAPVSPPPSITVRLNGVPSKGGSSAIFEHTVRTISEFEARLEAAKAARAAGLVQCVEIELIRD